MTDFEVMTDRLTLEQLVNARALIEEPEHWTTNILARTRFGHTTYPGHNDAFSFCALGALERVGVCWYITTPAAPTVLALAAEVSNVGDFVLRLHQPPETAASIVAAWNNTQGHAATLAMFDGAIAKLRAKLAVHDLMAGALAGATQVTEEDSHEKALEPIS